MSDPIADEATADQRALDEMTGDDVRLAARRAVAFLSACVDGEITDASVSERITAARSLLEYAARLPDVIGDLAGIADLASEDDVAVILTALD